MKHSLPLALAGLAFLPVVAHSQTLMRNVPGTAGQLYGSCMINAGDQNADGFEDLIVGAPGHSSGRGAIFCVSGLYLAMGFGPVHLWSITPSGNPGDEFGRSIALAGDLTGNSAQGSREAQASDIRHHARSGD